MNPRVAAEIALGVAGIWLIANRIPEIVLTFVYSPAAPGGILRWLGPLHFGLVVACGLGLVLLRRRIAAWLVPATQPDLSGSVSGIQAAAFSVVGVLIGAHALADLLGQLAITAADGRASVTRFAHPLFRVVIGLALFFGARGLVTLSQAGK